MVTLHSSWTNILLSVGGALILMALALLVAFSGAPVVVSLVLGLVALLAVLVTMIDLPIATEFTAEGLTRRALLRRQHLEWTEIQRLTRTRVGIVRTSKTPAGGLVAQIGRRRYLLVDKRESVVEFDEIRSVIGTDRSERLGLTNALRPADGTPPTWLYRRKKWRP